MEFLEKYHQVVKDYLANQDYNPQFKNLYDPVDYTLKMEGKRIRPILAILAYDLYGTDRKEVLAAAAAVEIFHNFTLLHDDIMDAAPVRRGQPSVYKKYGTNAAILSGDVMLLQAYRMLENYPADVQKQLTAIFSQTAVEVCEGQQLDIDFETIEEVKIKDYILMITLKTSVLLAASLKMGAIIGGAGAQEAEHLYEFGKNVGIAFQLQDDILDAYGEATKVGKQKGGDIIQKKKTYLYLKTRNILEGKAQKDFIDLYNGDSADKVARVMDIFNSCVVKEYAEQVKEAHLTLGMSHLNALGLAEEKRSPLELLAKYLLERAH